MYAALKNCVRGQMSYGLWSATRQLRAEWKLNRIHRNGVRKAERLKNQKPIQLHLGCGPNLKEGWLNVDLFDSRADLQLDLRETWPFQDNSIARIYSEHVFEHFEFHVEAPHFLREAFRVLEPGGEFDVVVPDTEPPLKAYRNSDASYWSVEAKRWHPAWCETELDHINFHFRQDGEHKYAWDGETLGRTLKAAGFTAITRREFDPRMDTEERRIGSLYMKAAKP
jgi:predicted SAM-dependent methyltransferase